jgi:hypothetical protein
MVLVITTDKRTTTNLTLLIITAPSSHHHGLAGRHGRWRLGEGAEVGLDVAEGHGAGVGEEGVGELLHAVEVQSRGLLTTSIRHRHIITYIRVDGWHGHTHYGDYTLIGGGSARLADGIAPSSRPS